MIFAAGLGTRLKPITDSMPKALVEVGGRPMLHHVLMRLVEVGITEVVINVHHFASMISEYLKSNCNFGLTIHISDESGQLLDTGGGILAARKWLDCADGQPFVVYNADILTDFDLADMIRSHINRNADSTLLVSNRSTVRYFMFDVTSERLRGWTNISTGEVRPRGLDESCCRKYAFGGIHILSPSVFDQLALYSSKSGSVFSITPFYIDACDRLDILPYKPAEPYRWIDIGKHSSLIEARGLYDVD